MTIPRNINRGHVLQAIREIDRDGVPRGRESRKFLVFHEGRAYPPKYVLSVASRHATGALLDPEVFSGGREANGVLHSLGFRVVQIHAVDRPRTRQRRVEPAPAPSPRVAPAGRHNERCPKCKSAIKALLTALYGRVEVNHKLSFGARLGDFKGASAFSHLSMIHAALQNYRGHTEFVRTNSLPRCDFYVPAGNFIVEFDESQHFTRCRALALREYPDSLRLGFDRRKWIEVCERIGASDPDPPYRDEQRAWYDSLRDFCAEVGSMRPTVRLYAGDRVWCEMDPANAAHLHEFASLVGEETPPLLRQGSLRAGRAATVPANLRVALVFPEIHASSQAGVPPTGPDAYSPGIPNARDFGGERLDLVVFPEGYIRDKDTMRIERLATLARGLGAHLLVGATQAHSEREAEWQILLWFRPDGSWEPVYRKHSTAGAIAFEDPQWSPESNLPVLDINGVPVGLTVCHDSYLGLLQRALAKRGARVWVNPSYDNVVEEKWAAIHRLRAIELGVTALCTLHTNPARRKTHPFGFGPDGHELEAHPVGDRSSLRRLGEWTKAGIYVVEIDLGKPAARDDLALLPESSKRRASASAAGADDLRISVAGGLPRVWSAGAWKPLDAGGVVRAGQRQVMLKRVDGADLLDVAVFFRGLHEASRSNASPVFWNHWQRLPASSDQLVSILLGRTLETCSPVILSDQRGIHEVVTLANKMKNLRRVSFGGVAEASVELSRAWGLKNAFKMAKKYMPGRDRDGRALRLYAGLATGT